MDNKESMDKIFQDIESLTNIEKFESLEILFLSKVNLFEVKEKDIERQQTNKHRPLQWKYVQKLIDPVNHLSELLKENEGVLISVKNQKLLRCCFQLITSMGILPCLISGVGIDLKKRSDNASKLTPMNLDDTGKYNLLKMCTDFFTTSYKVPVLKNIIVTLHLADYLAALIQLSFAPLKKPGIYDDFTMTQDMYNALQADRTVYSQIFENVVSTSFQPMLMKELMILQSSTNPPPPMFLKRVTSMELSKRLLAPGGLLSLIRCFIDSQSIDPSDECKKIHMIQRIVGTRHGSLSEQVYLTNICSQLKEAMNSNNIHYYSTGAMCILHLREKYPQSKDVEELSNEIIKAFDPEHLKQRSSLPGTILLTSQEIEQKINLLHSIFCSMRLNESTKLSLNFYVLFLIRLKCTKSQALKEKLDELILKHLETSDNNSLTVKIKHALFGRKDNQNYKISIEEFDSGIIMKNVSEDMTHLTDEAVTYLLLLLKKTGSTKFASKIFEICLEMLLALTKQRQRRTNRSLLSIEEESDFLDNLDTSYAVTLRLLEELSSLPNVLSFITENPECIISFMENILLQSKLDKNDECVTIALVLLNTIMTESEHIEILKKKICKLIPVLEQISRSDSDNGLLANEILAMTSDEKTKTKKISEYEVVLSNIFDNLLPVRAHGLIELTKLVEKKDAETISKKHFVLCLFQEHLKDGDSYIYLSAINGIAALGRHSTEDVLSMLCKEYLETSALSAEPETKQTTEQKAQMKMKVGDAIVKVTKGLGEMAGAHKPLLLNTAMCACRDPDPLLRTSALSNLAEITLALHYKLGTIIYEILLCIWNVLETDKAPECRRAAVMVVSSLLKGLGKDTLIELKDTLLPLYRTLKKLHHDSNEDSVVRLHAQIALEELNDIVKDFIFQKVDMEKKIVISGVDKMEIKFK